MSKVVISVDGNRIGDCALDKERVTIGRHPDNDIVLKDDRAASGHHAVILTIMSDSFLEDLDSTNGTVVNGKQVSKHPLSNGDVIQIGRHSLKYEGKVTDYDADFEKTMILKPSEIIAATQAPAAQQPSPPQVPQQPAGPQMAPPPGPQMAPPPAGPQMAPPAGPQMAPPPAAAPAPPVGPPPLGKVSVLNGANAGKDLQLTKALTTLGKPGVQVAAITRRPDGYYIVHVGPPTAPSRPKVNDQMISSQAQRLASNDTIEIAGTQMRFTLIQQ